MRTTKHHPSTVLPQYCAALACAALLTGASVAQPVTSESEPEPELTVREIPSDDAQGTENVLDDLPDVVKNLEQRGVQIIGKLPEAGGLTAYAAIAQQQPLAIYLTPDKKHVIIGTMLDEEGMDVTQSRLEQATTGPWTTQTWDALTNSTWIADGSPDAARIIYMFTDANCPFCHSFWEQARPWVQAGAVQIRHIPVAVLTESSAGKAAAILASADPEKALNDHETAGVSNGIKPLDTIPKELAVKLEKNTELMAELQIEGTPGIFYFDDDEQLQIQRGAPLDDDLEKILGPRE